MRLHVVVVKIKNNYDYRTYLFMLHLFLFISFLEFLFFLFLGFMLRMSSTHI